MRRGASANAPLAAGEGCWWSGGRREAESIRSSIGLGLGPQRDGRVARDARPSVTWAGALLPCDRACPAVGTCPGFPLRCTSLHQCRSFKAVIARSNDRKTVNKIMMCFRGNRHEITRVCRASRVRKPIACVAARRRLGARASERCSSAECRRCRRCASPFDSTWRSRCRPIVPRATSAERHRHAQTEDSAPSVTAQGADRATHRVRCVVQGSRTLNRTALVQTRVCKGSTAVPVPGIRALQRCLGSVRTGARGLLGGSQNQGQK